MSILKRVLKSRHLNAKLIFEYILLLVVLVAIFANFKQQISRSLAGEATSEQEEIHGIPEYKFEKLEAPNYIGN